MENGSQDPRNNRRKRLGIIYIVLGIVLVLAAASYFFLVPNSPNKDGDTTNNTTYTQIIDVV